MEWPEKFFQFLLFVLTFSTVIMEDDSFTFEDLCDEYAEDIKNKSIAPIQSYGEIIVHPSQSVLTKSFQRLFNEVRNFEVFPDDVWVVTFPKSGTTWTQEMVWLLMNKLDFKTAKSVDLSFRVPFFDSQTLLSKIEKELDNFPPSIEKAKNLERPRCIKSHLPVELLPKQLWTVKPKIIHVARDPRDVAISYYHHHRLWNGYQGTLEDFVDVFLHDRVVYSPYWGHLLGFMDLQDKSHVLFNTYEDMKKDLGKVIRKTAQFLNVEINDEQVEQLKEHLSFKNMKENLSVNGREMEDEVKKDINADLNDQNLHFIRKGESGGWKKTFGNDTIEKFRKWNEDWLKDRDFKDYPWS